MIKTYNLIGREFEFELHDEEELTSDLIKKFGCNVDMETVYAYNYLLKEGDYFIDVGANIGWTTVFASMSVGDSGRVFSFEPDEKNYQLLINNVERNHFQNVTTIKQALSNSEYTGQLYRAKENFGNHMLDPAFYNPENHLGRISVPVTTLDKFLLKEQIDAEKIALIKVDVEGTEPRVFEGGKRYFESYRPNIIVEFSPFQMKQCGHSAFDILSFIDRYEYRPHLFGFIELDRPEYNIIPLSVMDLIYLTKDMLERGAYKDLLLIHQSRL